MNNEIDKILKSIYLPQKGSHKGQNGKVLIIGGSKLFHSASLWALKTASRIVDLVHYASTVENNKIVMKLNEEFRDGMVIERKNIEDYIEEDDCILIGPGMVRADKIYNLQFKIYNLEEILKIKDEGLLTYYLTKYLLNKYPHKKWVIDAGALQMLEPEWIPKGAIITPHKHEFNNLKVKIQNSRPQLLASSACMAGEANIKTTNKNSKIEEDVKMIAKKYSCTVLLKGEEDIISDGEKIQNIKGGNAGMTKGGTGDVLAGLVAGLYAKNDAFASVVAASYINKKAGEELFETMGYWFNASDLCDQIPKTMKGIMHNNL